MLITNRELLNKPVLSIHTGQIIGEIVDTVINPDNLQLLAFYVNGPEMPYAENILILNDIREINRGNFVIDSIDNIVSPSDLIRLRPLFERDFRLLGSTVIDEENHLIGKITGYTIDPQFCFIQQLYIKPTGFHFFSVEERLINRNQILDVREDNKIVVRIPREKSEQKEIKEASLFINPFSETIPTAIHRSPQ